MVALVGISAGSLVWLVAASIGLAALLQLFPRVIQSVSALGGIYVAILGVATIRACLVASNGERVIQVPDQKTDAAAGALRQGFLVQILNPNALLFFSAVLPPFIDPARSLHLQIVVLGLTTIAIDAAVMAIYGMAASQLSKLLSTNATRIGLDMIVGSTLTILGLFVAWRAGWSAILAFHQ